MGMQVPGWKMPDRPLVDTLSFRPSCEEPLENDTRLDPVEVARQRLLELELAIERRYLKAPLGHNHHDVTLQTITNSKEKQNDMDESMDTDEREEHNDSVNLETDTVQECDITPTNDIVENGVDSLEETANQTEEITEEEREQANKNKRPTEEI